MRMTGRCAPTTSTRLIWTSTLRVLVTREARQSTRRSAQSPPCRTKRLPATASASWSRSRTISQLVTSGGNWLSSRRTRSSAAVSGYSGCWSAGRARHDAGVHEEAGGALETAMNSHGSTGAAQPRLLARLVGAERTGRQAGLVDQIAGGIVRPGVAHSGGIRHLLTRHHHSITVDPRFGRHEVPIPTGDGEARDGGAAFRLHPVGMREVDPHRGAFGGRLLEDRSTVFERFSIGDMQRRQCQTLADILLVLRMDVR